MKNRMGGVLLWVGTVCGLASGAEPVSFSGFIDTYYAFDFGEPTGDRSFTTTAARSNEFSVNLAYVDVKLEREKVRGRFALQTGSSVYANYSSEKRYGVAQGPELADLMRHIQEAYAGYRVAENVWVEAGIFLSHIGAESFISKENWNYTRSLGADYSPYYQSGVRVSYQPNPQWAASLHLMNGWQNTIETNKDKAIGVQLAFTPHEDFSVTYNNFIGQESAFRFFNNLILKAKLTAALSVSFSSDLGMQKRPGGGYSTWLVETLLAQWKFTETLALGGRVEYFQDKDQVVVTAGAPLGFEVMGASVNLDWRPETYLLFRNELRALSATDAIFAGKTAPSKTNVLAVTSLALTF